MKKVREKLNAKLRKNGGFTLIEMLIVVAIIAILIAVSIPLVGSALEKARDATDQANERAAKAAAVIKYLGIEDDLTAPGAATNVGTFYYDADKGALQKDNANNIKPYGKCKGGNGCYQTDSNHTENNNDIIKVVIADDGEVTLSWGTSP